MAEHRTFPAAAMLAWAALAASACVIDQPGMGLLQPPRTGHPLAARAPVSQVDARPIPVEDAPAPAPAPEPAPSCQDTFLPPFETPLIWRAAYRSATPGQFHHCPAWSSFGPVRPRGKWHRGLDISATTGTPVHAAIAGTLSYARDPNGWGLFARVKFRPALRAPDGSCSRGDPLEILYAHLQEGSAAFAVGEEHDIPPGAIVGRVGCSGNARGMCSPSPESHVHVTLRTIQDHRQIDPHPLFGWKPATPGPADYQPSLLPCP